MIRPLGKNIVVRRIEAQDKSDGGIFIPDNAKEKPAEGTILAIGPNVTEVKVDEKVLFAKYSGTEFVEDSETLLLLTADDIFGVRE